MNETYTNKKDTLNAATYEPDEPVKVDDDFFKNNEDALLEGLFAAGDMKNDDDLRKTIQIVRPENGKKRVFFEFTVGPLTEHQALKCRKEATKMVKNPMGKNYPLIEGDTDLAKSRSLQIYYATIDSDRAKLWNNKKAMDRFNCLQGWEVIDKVLLAGEKSMVLDVISDLSGYSMDEDEFIKN